jgi:glycerol-1-phosphate dehydrogenase [NAD(P)+]
MDQHRIAEVLAAATDTYEFLLGSGALTRTPEVFRRVFGDAAALIVADSNTWRAAGANVDAAFSSTRIRREEPILFPGVPVLAPDYRHIETIRERIRQSGAVPVAVGAGTINDLVKRAAHEAGVRFLIVTTAASVDGFAAFGAAIIKDSLKQTLACAAPAAIVADVDVLRAAPAAMTGSGYADLMSEVTARADWLVADALGIEAIHPVAWRIVQTELRRWISRPSELRAGDPGAFEDLFEGLSMNGFAMQAMRSSRPASGAEHLFSHIWEMEHLQVDGAPVSHGFKLAIGTLAATALMERLLARDALTLDIPLQCRQWGSWEQREAEVRNAFASSPILEGGLPREMGRSRCAGRTPGAVARALGDDSTGGAPAAAALRGFGAHVRAGRGAHEARAGGTHPRSHPHHFRDGQHDPHALHGPGPGPRDRLAS